MEITDADVVNEALNIDSEFRVRTINKDIFDEIKTIPDNIIYLEYEIKLLQQKIREIKTYIKWNYFLDMVENEGKQYKSKTYVFYGYQTFPKL